jgi:hypothetical protein
MNDYYEDVINEPISLSNYNTKENVLIQLNDQLESNNKTIKDYTERIKKLKNRPTKNCQELITCYGFVANNEKFVKDNQKRITELEQQLNKFDLAFLKENF